MDNSNFLKFDETGKVLTRCNKEATGKIIIPDSVTEIGSMAFGGCTGLTSIEIPDSVKWIRKSAFAGCTGLTEINVEPTNKHYTSVDGVLYNKDKSEIIRYPSSHQGESFIIPDSVTNFIDNFVLS